MSSSENHTWPVRARNTTTGALRTWRHLQVGGHAACTGMTGFGLFLGYCIDESWIIAAVVAVIYAVYSVIMAEKITNLTE